MKNYSKAFFKKKGNAKKNQSSDPVFFSRQSEDNGERDDHFFTSTAAKQTRLKAQMHPPYLPSHQTNQTIYLDNTPLETTL
jgi:hypothetical protein